MGVDEALVVFAGARWRDRDDDDVVLGSKLAEGRHVSQCRGGAGGSLEGFARA